MYMQYVLICSTYVIHIYNIYIYMCVCVLIDILSIHSDVFVLKELQNSSKNLFLFFAQLSLCNKEKLYIYIYFFLHI